MTDWAIAVTPPGWRRWLLAETPHSRLQALFPFDCKPQEIVGGVDVRRIRPGRHGAGLREHLGWYGVESGHG